ncbi:hypothetical protein EDB80DRAFT_877276 [Ilyonectria destructans]|nr:hypothetical protein EDB80DRAFT_877276 [Ilyonectria destructans]
MFEIQAHLVNVLEQEGNLLRTPRHSRAIENATISAPTQYRLHFLDNPHLAVVTDDERRNLVNLANRPRRYQNSYAAWGWIGLSSMTRMFQRCYMPARPLFPGVHYDLGRQRFQFLRSFGGGWLERLLSRWDWASKEIQLNDVLADLGFKWMLQAVRANDPAGEVIPALKVDQEIVAANQRMVLPNRKTGDRDVYMNVVEYLPFGNSIVSALTALWGTRWQRNQIYQLLADLNSLVYDFKAVDSSITGAGVRPLKH